MLLLRRAGSEMTALALAAAACGAYGWLIARGNPDPAAFVAAGERLLSRHGLSVFDDSYLQIGPLYLLAEGAASRFARVTGVDPLLAVSVSWCVALVLWTRSIARTCLASGSSAMRSPAAWATALTLVFALPLVATSGHFEEVATGLALVNAGLMAGRGRPMTAGTLVAAAIGLKAWGVLGLPLILLCRGRRERLVMAGVAVGVSLATYSPFILSGHMATAAHAWHVAVPSVLSLVLAPGTVFGLGLRLMQTVAALGMGAAIAWRRRQQAETAAPEILAAVIVVRLLTDPYPQSYYAAPLLMTVIFAALSTRPATNRSLLELVGVATAIELSFAVPGIAGSLLQLGVGATLVSFETLLGKKLLRFGKFIRPPVLEV